MTNREKLISQIIQAWENKQIHNIFLTLDKEFKWKVFSNNLRVKLVFFAIASLSVILFLIDFFSNFFVDKSSLLPVIILITFEVVLSFFAHKEYKEEKIEFVFAAEAEINNKIRMNALKRSKIKIKSYPWMVSYYRFTEERFIKVIEQIREEMSEKK